MKAIPLYNITFSRSESFCILSICMRVQLATPCTWLSLLDTACSPIALTHDSLVLSS